MLVRSPLFFLRSELWECEEAGSFDVVSGPGSLVIVGVLASESALLAAAPCVPRGLVQASGQHRDGTKGRSLYFHFFFTGFLCVSVCCEALSDEVEIVSSFPCVGSSR